MLFAGLQLAAGSAPAEGSEGGADGTGGSNLSDAPSPAPPSLPTSASSSFAFLQQQHAEPVLQQQHAPTAAAADADALPPAGGSSFAFVNGTPPADDSLGVRRVSGGGVGVGGSGGGCGGGGSSLAAGLAPVASATTIGAAATTSAPSTSAATTTAPSTVPPLPKKVIKKVPKARRPGWASAQPIEEVDGETASHGVLSEPPAGGGGLDQMGGGLDQRFDPHGTAGTNLSQTSAGGREGLGAGGLGGLPSWGSLEPRRESREPVWAGGGALAPPPDELEPLGGGLEPLGGGVPDAPEAAGALASFERGLSGELGGGVGAPPPGVSSGALPFSDWSVPVDPSRQAADEVISPPAPPPTNPPPPRFWPHHPISPPLSAP